ncbi:ER-golgi trafficking TRAPP I complex 85 kDa subunit-domain-containing protein [Naematelia encephala]|uniref:ER-golgi trafficking TRAPP I complex 85 kDa subunit-domain-containing protein n=1 Tax=Naematelia encephala TaxID=71784 RepID=A0A1Y2AP80_9TREE|nr:ER-golgi trafficking TRAPP I complex 85 kDa subunit-domain-containing protein [Naematelia encephala]
MPSPPLSLVQALSPRIAVLTSDDVVDSCEANGCRGLEELLRPWEGSTERVSILSSTLTPTIHPTFPLRFVSYASVFPDPSGSSLNPDMVIDLIGSYVGVREPSEEQQYPLTRSLLLASRPLASHETFNHPIGVLLAISTATPEPLETLAKLHGRSVGPAAQAVPWMDGVNVMRLYVVVHDVGKMGSDLEVAQNLLASVKKAYGPHSTLLVINSQVERRPPPPSPDVSTHSGIPLPRALTPDDNPSALSQVYASALSSLTLSPLAAASATITSSSVSETPHSPTKPARRKLYGAKLTGEDTQRLVALVRELVVQSLVPWMEARIREWNEVWQTNRRGITGRLFGAGRKLFGSRPSSPAPNGVQAGYNMAKGYYPVTSVEALTRRLGDFAFMLRDYRFASTVYDSLRRDAAQDRAWRWAAAATEMYGLSQLLSNPYFLPSTPPTLPSNPFTTLQHTEISSWLEQAVYAYQSHTAANQIHLDAMRITVLYYEAWKMIGEWRGVGSALVRAAGEADEVPSAVFIEEAAGADVKGGKSKRGGRRSAFHLVMAARRYETAGFKSYSRRCLDRASSTYRSAPWTAAQDRIEYSLGRQAYTLGQSDVAVEHFLRLLRREENGVPGSQGMVLEDMALAYEQLCAHPQMLAATSGKLQLPTPAFDVKATRIVPSSSVASGSGSSERWAALQDQVLNSWDRKGKKPMSLVSDERTAMGVGESILVELVASNPLNAPLALTNLTLLVDSLVPVEIETIPEVILEPYEIRPIRIELKCTEPTTLTITSVSFLFHRFFPCTQPLRKRGKRLYATKAHRLDPTYATDTSLSIVVERSKPRLKVELDGLPEAMYEGEVVEGVVKLMNSGKEAVEDVRITLSEHGMLQLSQTDTPALLPNTMLSLNSIILYSDPIQPGETVSVPIILVGRERGLLQLLGLVVFASTEDPNEVVTAKVAHTVEVQSLLKVSASVRPARTRQGVCLLGVEVVNESASTVSVNDIYSVSPYWVAEGPSGSHELHPNQRLRIYSPVRKDDALDTVPDVWQKSLVADLGRLVQGQQQIDIPAYGDVKLSGASKLAPEALQTLLSARRSHRESELALQFPGVSRSLRHSIFPLFDPLDLDLYVSWSTAQDGESVVAPRHGHAYLSGVRVAPEFSIVESVRREVDAALASGSKQTRTMYEETLRLRRVLMDSVLEGVLAREDDPVALRVKVETEKGTVVHDFAKGPCETLVRFDLSNRSPALATRWVLRLSSGHTSSRETRGLQGPHFVGALSHRGRLEPGSSQHLDAPIWTHEPGLISLSGWELEVETGLDEDGIWVARRSWTRRGEGGAVEVVQGDG